MPFITRRKLWPNNAALVPAGGAAAATTWDSGFKTANLTLSNASRTVTFNAGGNEGAAVRSVAATVASQKVYIEHVVGTVVSAFFIGFVTSASTLTYQYGVATPSTAFFVATPGCSMQCDDSADAAGGFHIIGTGATSIAAGDRLGLALNTVTKQLWARKNGGAWCAGTDLGGSHDPVTNTGGTVLPFAGPYYAFVAMDANPTDVFTSNFASGDWADAVPSGYSQLAA